MGRVPEAPKRTIWEQPVVVTRHMRVGSRQVWEAMATPGGLARYHPFCSGNPVTTWPGVGSQDTVQYLSGIVLHRRFKTWDEGRGYELEIGSGKGAPSRVRWELVAAGERGSALTISIWPSAFLGYPQVLRWVLYRLFLLPLLRRYLRSVLEGLEYFLTTGRDVSPNQFGRVWYFSYWPSRSRGGAV